ncbi:hypothetical protein SeLEV6574_g06601 [Synchytrium endobioticum]|uniref:Kinesin-like protein n=1 Tax=Synchytrium endobioticum TaxID=286115 RepID=A0A507CMR2_9FUNG|nr:hypothetical protein SeLEV6574_g06601 [Synchytrium endobioticum]
MSAVRVVLRARPLSPKETEKHAKVVLHFPDETHCTLSRPTSTPPHPTTSTTTASIRQPSPTTASSRQPSPTAPTDDLHELCSRTFTFDQCLWSVGYDRSACASQQTVYQVVGKELVDHVLHGYNICILAYGQTGSGKTYSMMGNSVEKGLIAHMCEAILNAPEESNWRREFELSYMEVYNEKVRDLLNPSNKGNLRVREHPSLGPYVEDLSKSVVGNYRNILALIDAGNKARSVASTNMNEASSRSHAIVTLTITQKYFDPNNSEITTEKVSRACFVDLAGSERAAVSGTSGLRLKEGAQINKSLSTLGKVISMLAERSTKGNKAGMHIPYRDSVLTWLLKDCLGGNSKTTLLALVSPTDTCHNETLSTCRFAERAKRIINTPVVNEDANGKFIRELQEEVERLKSQLEGYQQSGTTGGIVDRLSGGDEALQSMQEDLLANKKLLEEMMESYGDKLRKTEAIQRERERALEELGIVLDASSVGVYTPKTIPHLVNLNEDPFMTECLIYKISPGISRVGRAGSYPHPDIGLSGDNILPDHCHFTRDDDGAVTITPADNENALVLVNGRRLDGAKRLKSGYRLIIGDNHIFRFNHPLELQWDRIHQHQQLQTLIRGAPPRRNSLESQSSRTDSSVIDWSFAVREREEWEGHSGSANSNDESESDRGFAIKYSSNLPKLKPKDKQYDWDGQAQRIADLEAEIAAAKTHVTDMEKASSGSRPSSVGSGKSFRSNSPDVSSAASTVSVINVGGATITVGEGVISRMQQDIQRELDRIGQMERKLQFERQALLRRMSSDTLRNPHNNSIQINVIAYTERERQLIVKAVTKWRSKRWVAMARELERLKITLKEVNIMSIELGAGVAYAPYIGDLSRRTSFWDSSDGSDTDDFLTESEAAEDIGVGVFVLDFKHESVYLWPLSQLKERLPYMHCMYNYFENKATSPISKPTDIDAVFGGSPGRTSRPFFTRMGSACISARNLAYKRSKLSTVCVYSSEADVIGWLKVKIEPVGLVGAATSRKYMPISPGPVESDELMIGTDIVFEISIIELDGVDEMDWTQVHAQTRMSSFGLRSGKDKKYASVPAIGFGRKPIVWDFSQTVSLKVDTHVKQIIERGVFEIDIYGRRRQQVSEVISDIFGFSSELDMTSSATNSNSNSTASSPRRSMEEDVAERAFNVKSPQKIEAELAEAQSTNIMASVRSRALENRLKQEIERQNRRVHMNGGAERRGGRVVFMRRGTVPHNRSLQLPSVWRTVEAAARSIPLPGNNSNSNSNINGGRFSSNSGFVKRRSTTSLNKPEGHKKKQLDAFLQTRVLELSPDGEFRDVPIQCSSVPQTTIPVFQLKQGLQRRMAIRLVYSVDAKYVSSMKITGISIGGSAMEVAQIKRLSLSINGRRNSVSQQHPGSPSSVTSKRSSMVLNVSTDPNGSANDLNSNVLENKTIYVRDEEVSRQKASKDLSGGKGMVDVVFTWDSGSPEVDRETEDGKKVVATLSVEAIVDGGLVDSMVTFSTRICFVVQPRLAPLTGRLSNFISRWSTPPVMISRYTSLFELLLKKIPLRSTYWLALDTSNEYVRGEEALNGWSPRGRELVAHFIRNRERLSLLREVEIWRGRWEQVEGWSTRRGASASAQWNSEEAAAIQRRVLELWKDLGRSHWRRYYNSLLGVDNRVSLDDDVDGSNGDEELWGLEVKALPQRNPIITHSGYLSTPDEASGTATDSAYAPLVFSPKAQWRRRYFVLQRPYLFMYADETMRDEVNVVPVRDVHIKWESDIAELLHRQHTFSMYSNQRNYLFQADSEEAAAEWASALDPLQFSSAVSSLAKSWNVQ